MDRKDRMDAAGAAGMVVFAVMLAFNQVVIKFSNGGFGPVFGAGLRSVLGLAVLGLWMLARRRGAGDLRATLWPGLMLGALFSVEFILLFLAMDYTAVSRASIGLYSMPVWLGLIAHFALPGEQLSGSRALGLVLAMAGVAWALADPESRAGGDWRGDLLAVAAAWCWAGIALTVRLTRISRLPPEGQLVWQLGVSAAVLCAAAPLFGDLLRDPGLLASGAIGYGALIVGLGFLFWLRLMSIYPASDVASFSFLSPVLAVGFGWLLLDEPLSWQFGAALVLVAVGIVLINRR